METYKSINYIYFLFKYLTIGVFCIILGACSLPRGTAMLEELMVQKPKDIKQFKRYDVTSELISKLENSKSEPVVWPKNETQTYRLAPGEMVHITIWNSSSSSLFLIQGQKNVTLPAMRINQVGEIFFPYVGNVKIGGLDIATARLMMETQIKLSSPNAQIQLNIDPGAINSFKFLGDVVNSGKYAIEDENLTIISALALVGGISNGITNPQLHLERKNKKYTISLNALYNDADLNIQVIPGDFLRITADIREFQVLGASGNSKIINFDSQEISVRKAIAMAGGLDGSKSNPKGVLLLRNREQLNVIPEPQIFVFDLTSPDSLFASEEFLVADNDLILVTESPAISYQLILSLIAMSVGILK
mgnify:CR=1 FL=1